jgi:hypothetical protein
MSNRIPETLPDEVLAKMHAPPKKDYPVITANDLPQFDAFAFGIPTRYGNFPGQWKVRSFTSSFHFVLSFRLLGGFACGGAKWLGKCASLYPRRRRRRRRGHIRRKRIFVPIDAYLCIVSLGLHASPSVIGMQHTLLDITSASPRAVISFLHSCFTHSPSAHHVFQLKHS